MEQILEYSKTIPQRTVQNSLIGNLLNQGNVPARNLGGSRSGVLGRAIPPMPALRVKVPMTEVDYGECYYDDEEERMDFDEMEPPMPVRPRAPPISRQQPAARPAAVSRSAHSARASSNMSQSSANYPRMRQDWVDLQKTRYVYIC